MSGREVTVGAAQWLPGGAPGRNPLDEAVGFIRDLAAAGAEVIALPELWPCSHDPADDIHRVVEEVQSHAQTLGGPRDGVLAEIAAEEQVWLAAGSVPERYAGAVYNTAQLFSPAGDLHAIHRKAHLYGGMQEDRVFASGNCLTVCDVGPLGRTGLAICFDGDFPEVARGMRAAGARVVIHLDAYETHAEHWWDRIYPANALVNGQWWIMVNQCGTRGATTFLGKSQIVSPLGRVVARAPRAALGETPDPTLLLQTIPLDAELHRAGEGAAVLFDQARPGLPVRSGVPDTALAGGACR